MSKLLKVQNQKYDGLKQCFWYLVLTFCMIIRILIEIERELPLLQFLSFLQDINRYPDRIFAISGKKINQSLVCIFFFLNFRKM